MKVGDGDALVFQCPTDTTFVALDDGGVFARNVRFASLKVARAAIDEAPKWVKTRATIDLEDGRIVVLDAAYPYRGCESKLVAKLGAGRYRISACDFYPTCAPDYECRAYRLIRG